MNNNNNHNAAERNAMKREFMPSDAEALEHVDASMNRNQAMRLLANIKSRDTHNELTKIVWADKQPCIVTTTRPSFKRHASNKNLSDGRAATDSYGRVASSWEAKRDQRDRRGYTLDETPTMQFKGSSNLPAEYYQDNEAIEAYVNTLKDNTYNG